MKPSEIACNGYAKKNANSQLRFTQRYLSARYQKTLDGRKPPMRSLWIRNGTFIAQLRVPDLYTGRLKKKWILLKIDKGLVITLIAEARYQSRLVERRELQLHLRRKAILITRPCPALVYLSMEPIPRRRSQRWNAIC